MLKDLPSSQIFSIFFKQGFGVIFNWGGESFSYDCLIEDEDEEAASIKRKPPNYNVSFRCDSGDAAFER